MQGKNANGSGHYADGITNESVDDNKKRPGRYIKLQVCVGGRGAKGGMGGKGGRIRALVGLRFPETPAAPTP